MYPIQCTNTVYAQIIIIPHRQVIIFRHEVCVHTVAHLPFNLLVENVVQQEVGEEEEPQQAQG